MPGRRVLLDRTVRLALAPVLIALMAACATRTAPAVPATPAHPEFMYPAVPQALQQVPGADRIDLGWRYLQNDQTRNADRQFTAALDRSTSLYPAHAGRGYVALAEREYDKAVAAFDMALTGARDYVPALVGRGQALLALRRDDQALQAFEAALAVDPSLADVRRRVEVLRFRGMQELIESARSAASAGRLDEARAAYERAVTASPESAFLHRELGIVKRRQGDLPGAIESLRRATTLDPSDAAALIQMGEVLAQQQDFAGAEAALRKAADIEPSPELSARIADVSEKARDARLPAEFRQIAARDQITRGELAALLGVRLEPVLREAPARQAVMTDTRGHWALPWITLVAGAGVIDPFENHTFQPDAVVRRGDLALAVSRVVRLIGGRDPAVQKVLVQRPVIADLGPGHLSYPAAAVAVSTGVMPLVEGNRFEVARAVSGAEAVQAVDRLRAMATQAGLIRAR